MMSELSTGFDPSSRDLCPDGACIGVIGPDGRCKVCGQEGPTGSAERARDGKPTSSEDKKDRGPAKTAATGKGSGDRPDLDIETRELCPDGACIGVIGPDGRCKVCGKSL